MKTCINCNKNISDHLNYCSWECNVELAKKNGGKIITPNNLPIRCIKYDNTMLEHEHGDHPSYKYPINVKFIGELKIEYFEDFLMITGKEGTPEEIREFFSETHALIFSDNYIALTLYECSYALWDIRTGKLLYGSFSLWKQDDHQIDLDGLI